MKTKPPTQPANPLRQIAVITNAAAEDAVAALLEREFGQTPSVYADMATGLSTVRDRKSTRLNSSHGGISRMPSSA